MVLLDEVEKGHQDVFNILLQMLDDGRLTDGHGRTVDFRNTVVIMTSNLGSQYIVDMTSPGQQEEMHRLVNEVLRQTFRPEFLNRVDEVVIFDALKRGNLRQIVDIQLRGLAERLRDREVEIELAPAAKDHLIERGFDPAYGARPLKRVIQKEILDALALKLLEGQFRPGDTVLVDARGDELVFTTPEPAGAAAD